MISWNPSTFLQLNCGRTGIHPSLRNSWNQRRGVPWDSVHLLTASLSLQFHSVTADFVLSHLWSSKGLQKGSSFLRKMGGRLFPRTLIGLAKFRYHLLDCITLSWQCGHIEVWKFLLQLCASVCLWMCMVEYGWKLF